MAVLVPPIAAPYENDKARKMLEWPEMQGAMARLTALSLRASEAAARQKTEKIISSELKKAACKPELNKRVAAISPLSGLHSTKLEEAPSEDSAPSSPTLEESTGSDSHSYSNSEHAYSTGM
ncbi:Lysine-specific demethylase 5A [Homalodisca vitripennis]|nr:Lysine-specific demethylase 5A [Homalodisca vitripennis]